jgi:hypothetical protein
MNQKMIYKENKNEDIIFKFDWIENLTALEYKKTMEDL